MSDTPTWSNLVSHWSHFELFNQNNNVQMGPNSNQCFVSLSLQHLLVEDENTDHSELQAACALSNIYMQQHILQFTIFSIRLLVVNVAGGRLGIRWPLIMPWLMALFVGSALGFTSTTVFTVWILHKQTYKFSLPHAHSRAIISHSPTHGEEPQTYTATNTAHATVVRWKTSVYLFFPPKILGFEELGKNSFVCLTNWTYSWRTVHTFNFS